MPQKDFVNFTFEEALSEMRGGLAASSFYTGPTPAETEAIYRRGFQGTGKEETPEERRATKELFGNMPDLYDVFPWARGIGKGKMAAPYLATLHFDDRWGGDEAQTRGSCTVHATANAAEMDHGNDALHGETKWMGRLVKENIYRSRGYNTDGWSCTAPAKYIGPTGRGGLLYRKKYGSGSNSIDFTNFGRDTEGWSGNGRAGVPGWLEEISRDNKAKWIIPINDMDRYRDAIYLGFGISVCSGAGYANQTDENGVARRQGSWSHAMAHCAYNDTPWAERVYRALIGMIQQSWGRWNRQNGTPDGSPKMPVGAFYARSNDIYSMLRGGDNYAICGVYGWDRVGWEAFDTSALAHYRDELLTHMRSSTVQDYYVQRAEKSQEFVTRALDERMFLTV